MTAANPLITAERLGNMPGYGRRELVRGMLRDFPLAGFEHGAIVATTATLLFIHVRQHGLGTVVSGHVGFILARSPDVVRGADVAFVCAARLKGSGRCVGYWDGPPDLAVEVASPSDSIEEIEEKLDDYLNAGTPMVWVINPRRRTVSVHRAGANPVILREHDALDGQEIVEGFRCMVSQLFE